MSCASIERTVAECFGRMEKLKIYRPLWLKKDMLVIIKNIQKYEVCQRTKVCKRK